MDEEDRMAQREEARQRNKPKNLIADDGVIVSQDVPDAVRR